MNSGKAIRQKIRDAIKAKLVDLGSYVDEELPDYIMVMLANKRSEAQMTQDLDLFLNNNTTVFTSWLFDLLRKLEQKPLKSEKKKKKKSKHRSQKAEASSSSQRIETAPPAEETVQATVTDVPADATPADPPLLPPEDHPPVPQESLFPPLPPTDREGSAPIISILPDTDDVLDKELTEEIDADRKKAKQQKLASSSSRQSPPEKKVNPTAHVKKKTPSAQVRKVKSAEEISDDTSYREHVIKQRAIRVEQIAPTSPEKLQPPATSTVEPATTTVAPQRPNVVSNRANVVPHRSDVVPHRSNVVSHRSNVVHHRSDVFHQRSDVVPERSHSFLQRTGVKLRLGERLVEEVIIDADGRKRKSPGSVIAQVIHHDSEEDSDDDGPATAKRVASSVRANRRPTLPTSRQANTALLKKAVTEAAASTSSLPERQAPTRQTTPLVKINRPQIPAASRPVAIRRIPQTRMKRCSTSLTSPTISSSDQGILSRSLLREMKDRDFDSQSFQTIEDEGDEGEMGSPVAEEQEEVQFVMAPPQQGVYVYKNVVAVVGEARSQQQRVKIIQPEIIEDVPMMHEEADDSRQIYMAENVSVADSTQSPEHGSEEEEMVEVAQEVYQQEEAEAKSILPASSSHPRFVVTLEGAKKHLKLSANQRRKNQKKTVKRGFVQHQPQPPSDEVFVVKQPRQAISPEVERKFVFSDVEPLVQEAETEMEEGDERTAVVVQEPYMVYPSGQHQASPYPAAPKVEPLMISMQDSDDDEGYAAEEGQQEVDSAKSNQRCKYWPACKNGDSCPYVHPTTQCRTFPRCKFGEKCLYIHPNCRFDSLCTKPSCPYTHATRKSIPPVVLQMSPSPVTHQPPPRQGKQTVCKFHPLCKNPQCAFHHPKPCRFGKSCSRQGCTFFHPTIALRSSLTWTKSSKEYRTPVKAQHMSQRQFAAPSASPALVVKPSPPPPVVAGKKIKPSFPASAGAMK